jgi:DNA ligase-1
MSEAVSGSMLRWAQIAERIRATPRTSEKTAIVSAYLRSLGPADLAIAAVFLSGRPFPERDQRKIGLGWAAVSAIVADVAGVDEGALRRAYDRSSDVGTAVAEVLAAAGGALTSAGGALTSAGGALAGSGLAGQEAQLGQEVQTGQGAPLMLGDVESGYQALAQARGREAKAAVFGGLLRRADPLSARYLTAILGGELRIGLREGHLEKAIATAFGRDLATVQWAGMLTGDIGRTAELARDDALDSARLTLFHPLKSMLASPVSDEREALDRLGSPVWVEDKYDGIRAQLHKQGARVHLYSRDLNELSDQFPEILAAAAGLPWDGILDGEILAFRDGLVLPFLTLQSRLGRKKPSAAILAEVPVIYVGFDVLALGEGGSAPAPLLRQSLRQRRVQLEALGLPQAAGFGLAALTEAADAAQLESIFDAAQARGNEGLMLKDPASLYTPGRRGYAWLKLKKALTTLDCVVVGVEVGHGRRHGVLSDYTFAVIDDRPGAPEGALVTIGKAYSGLTDVEIAAMTRWFEAHTISRHGRYRVVEPTVVVEIAFDVVHASRRHASGYALRFPRIVRIRDDKEAAEVDRLSTVAALHDRLQVAGRFGVLSEARSASTGSGDPER